MLIAQITDSHIEAAGVLAYGTFDSAASLTRIVKELNARDPQPDLILHTGDMAHHGSPEQYGPLMELVKPLKAPFFAIPGNHDSREGFRQAFAGTDWLPKTGEFIHYTIDDFPVRLICLDTVVPGVPYGMLCGERLAWLKNALAEAPDKPTIVACHHPPFATGLTGSTKVGLDQGGAEFAALLAENPQVQRLICGHVHRPISAVFGGRAAWASPATCYQFEAGMSAEQTLALTNEPPGYSLHAWVDDPVAGPNLASHFVPVGDFGDPIILMRKGERVGPLLNAGH